MYAVQTRYPGYSVPAEERHFLLALSGRTGYHLVSKSHPDEIPASITRIHFPPLRLRLLLTLVACLA